MSKNSFHIHRHQKHLKWTKNEPPRLTVDSGDVVTFDCIDGGNGQITPDSTADAVLKFDVTLADPVFGPVYVRGAEPGDALEVEVIDLETADWGWTAIVPKFGLLQEEFPNVHLKLWKLPGNKPGNGHSLANGDATSRLACFNDRIRIPIRPFMVSFENSRQR